MRILGPIVLLQIQRSALKVGQKPNRRYDPAPLLAVDRLEIGPEGAVARPNGDQVLDVHHQRHPASRNNDGENTLSVGFTSHYAAMQRRYGAHMALGCAGENIVVQADRPVTPGEVAGGLVILSAEGTERLRLVRASVAHPCKPFSGFAHRHELVEPDVLKETLRFLDGGMRGYYCAPQVTDRVEVCVGDVVAVIRV